MSLLGQREIIAAALSTVDGVTGHTYRPTTITRGSAWPLYESSTRSEEVPDLECAWRVIVILPAVDERAASQAFDALHDPIDEALAEVAYVDRIEPYIVVSEGGEHEAMMITMRREN